jgi:hypothetical protein
MLIHHTMDLAELAALMGPAADRVDAWHMRHELIAAGYEGTQIALIPAPRWLDLVDAAALDRANLDRVSSWRGRQPRAEVAS